ncbi:GPP34 family phosphoprotein [Jatrophihabitans sp. YIM 134969]
MSAASPLEPESTGEIVTGDRIATDLLRASVGTTGELVTRRGLAVCLRGALLADLALAGALADTGFGPTPTGESPPDDRILAAVHRTVQARPSVAWRRWFRHVDVDLAALADELVELDRWTETSRGMTRRVVLDRDAGGAVVLGRRARAVGLGSEPAASAREAVLGVLVASWTGAHGEGRPRDTVKLPSVLAGFDDVPGESRQAAHAAVGTAQVMLKKARRRWR